MRNFNELVSKEAIERAMAALKENGITAYYAASGEEAKKKVVELLPEGAEVMTMTSVTLDTLGVTEEVNGSGKYDSVRKKLSGMDRATQDREMQRLGAAPEWVLGSVHAVSEDGKVLVASNTGSQLPAYAYGAGHVIWVVGAQKLVADEEEGRRRIYEYVLPLEAERARKAYGVAGSNVSKLLIINEEVNPERLHMILVNEVLGF